MASIFLRSVLSFVAVLLLQRLGESLSALNNYTYENNGVRLVGGDMTSGRVELRPQQPYWPRRDWVKVCDSDFTDTLAEMLCKQLGFLYGRKYYTPDVAFPTTPSNNYVSHLSCYENSKKNQFKSAARVSERQALSSRRLLMPMSGNLDAPASSPYSCWFRLGTCNPLGPFAGLECSNNTLPPAPSPPPRPPNPPPPPPAVSKFIRIFTNNHVPDIDGSLEPNLCIGKKQEFCNTFGRMEILIQMSKGEVWAPVCNITDSNLARSVALLACEQRYQKRYFPWLPEVYMISGGVSKEAFDIPKKATGKPGDFNPKNVSAYVTIRGGDATTVTKLQDLNFTASSTPCRNSKMLAFACYFATWDDAIP